MPAAFAAPMIGYTLAGIGSASAAAAGIYGANKQSSANKRAAELAAQGNDKALAWEREQDALDRQQYAETEAANRQRWDIEANRDENRYVTSRGDLLRGEARDIDMYNAIQRNRQPFRNIGVAAAQDLARRAGLNVSDATAYQLANNVPANVTPQTMADLLKRTPATPINSTRSA